MDHSIVGPESGTCYSCEYIGLLWLKEDGWSHPVCIGCIDADFGEIMQDEYPDEYAKYLEWYEVTELGIHDAIHEPH